MVESMQETLKVKRCIQKHPWLIAMVKSKQFHEKCDNHDSKSPPKMRAYFCCDCMIPPLCITCYKKSEHERHTTIQTFRCSYQSGARQEDMSKYMDISGIHIYKINTNHIVYVNQRRRDDNHRFRNNVERKCQVCEWELDTNSSALFCSVQCKLKSALGSQLDDLLMENSEETEPVKKKLEISENSEESEPVKKKLEVPEETEPVNKKLEISEKSEETEPVKKNRHRRKGSPHRSPFY